MRIVDIRPEQAEVFLDPVLWLETFCMLDGLPLKLYDYQKKFLRDNSPFRIFVKSRQIGVSFICAGESLYKNNRNRGNTSLFVAQAERQAKEIKRHYDVLLDSLPDEIHLIDKDKKVIEVLEKPIRTYDTKTSTELSNGSRTLCLPNNPDTVRSFRAHQVYWDEAAKFPNDEDMNSAITPCLIRGGQQTLVSTLRGKRGIFWKQAEKAGFIQEDKVKPPDPDSVYVLHAAPWWYCPHLKDNISLFKRQMGGEMSVGFREEFCCIPVDPATAVFPLELLEKSTKLYAKGFKRIIEPSDLVTKNPLSIGIDVGRVADSSVLVATETTSDYKAVVRYLEEWNDKPMPEQVRSMSTLINQLNPSHVYVDMIGMGIAVLEPLQAIHGSKIEGVHLQKKLEQDEQELPIKERLVVDTLNLFHDGQVLIPPVFVKTETGEEVVDLTSEKLFNQMHSLERKQSKVGAAVKYEHPSGAHDDYAWGFMLSLMGIVSTTTQHHMILIGSDNEMVSYSPSAVALHPELK